MGAVENKIVELLEEHGEDSSWQASLLPWSRSIITPHSLAGYFTFAGDMNRDYRKRFEEVLACICSLDIEIYGFFYLRSSEGIHFYLKITANRITKIDPAPSLVDW